MIGLFLVIAVIIIGRLAYLQLVNNEKYTEDVVNAITTTTYVDPDRGKIYDTNMNLLATNVSYYDVYISPKDIITDQKNDQSDENDIKSFDWINSDGISYKGLSRTDVIVQYLVDELGASESSVRELLTDETSQYSKALESITSEQYEALLSFTESKGLTDDLYVEEKPKRVYPENSLAAATIGFCNSDGEGTYGIEAYYNDVLEGTSGTIVSVARGYSSSQSTSTDATNGGNVVSTIDTYVQSELESQLEKAYTENGGSERAYGVVMNVNTGAVLAMAQYPSYDLNDVYTLDSLGNEKLAEFVKDYDGDIDEDSEEYQSEKTDLLYDMWNNKDVTFLYEPGSTSKIVTTAMVLDNNISSWDEMFYCGGSLEIEGYDQPIKCWETGGHGQLNLKSGLQNSCNVVMMTLALRLGKQTFYKDWLSYGYGELTGIDLPNEAETIYHDYSDFSFASLATYSFGQTYKTTPIQQLTAISAIANGGYLVTPHVMKEVVDDDGNVLETYEENIRRQVTSEDVCKSISEVLEDGVSGGQGAKNVYVKGYKIAAKTGTSEKRDKQDSEGTYTLRVGSTVAYAPSDDPEIAVLFCVDEPEGEGYGSVVAAPYVGSLLSSILPYLGYEPSYTDAELVDSEVTIPSYSGYSIDDVKSDLDSKGIIYEVIGDGDAVTAQQPSGGSSIVKDSGKVYIYTGSESPAEDITVPDLTGMTSEAALRILQTRDLNISVNGATSSSGSTVYSQSVASGTLVSAGTCITVEMRDNNATSD